MKVDNIITKEMPSLRNEMTDKKNGAPDCKEFTPSSANDRVSISSLINQLNQAVNSESKDQARSERVAELKTLIEAGKYKVSGKAVAEKMLSLE